MDAATCDWADNLLATAHRLTPTARIEAKLTSVSCLKPGAEAKSSPVAFSLGNPGSSGFMSPPNRFLASVSKGSHPSRLGLASPLGGSAATPARGSVNPLASPQIGSAAMQGTFRQPLPQDTSTHFEGQDRVPLPQKIRGIPMQPLRPQTAPALPSLGMQSPSFRTRAAPGPAPVLPSQGVSRQPCLQGVFPQLSGNTLSNTASLVTAQSALTYPASSRQQFTITTGASSLGVSRPPHSITQSLFGKPVSTATIPSSLPTKVSLPEFTSMGSGQSSFTAAAAAAATTGLGASAELPAFSSSVAKSIMALPTGIVPVCPGGHMPIRTPTFMDSVAAFTEGFALTHSEPGSLGDWALGSKTELHQTGFAKDALEMFRLEAGMNSDISDDASEQMWKIPAEMLVGDTDDLGF